MKVNWQVGAVTMVSPSHTPPRQLRVRVASQVSKRRNMCCMLPGLFPDQLWRIAASQVDGSLVIELNEH